MQTSSVGPIMLLIALSGCTQNVEASDPPAILAPSEMVTDTPAASNSENEEQHQLRMQIPVEYD